MATADRNGVIRVQVTERDIERAKVKNSMHCVVAQAIARTIPDATRIDVDLQSIRWTSGGERNVYLTPYSVQGYVIGFDAGDTIHPFTFGLDTRKRIQVKSRKSTPAGKKVEKARTAKRAAERKVARLEAAPSMFPPPTPAESSVIAEQLVAARRERETATAKVQAAAREAKATGQPTKVDVGEGRTAPSRIHKSSERHYGRRLYRENQLT